MLPDVARFRYNTLHLSIIQTLRPRDLSDLETPKALGCSPRQSSPNGKIFNGLPVLSIFPFYELKFLLHSSLLTVSRDELLIVVTTLRKKFVPKNGYICRRNTIELYLLQLTIPISLPPQDLNLQQDSTSSTMRKNSILRQ